MKGTRHTPFSRIKSFAADITADEARAKGYITGEEKIDEVFELLGRATTPTTIYKKQKLDRDDVVDITDFDVIMWLRGEMRLMLDEEIARAILIGDGRPTSSNDKIKEANVRPIYTDEALYAHRVDIVEAKAEDRIDEIVKAAKYYKGSGTPSLFASPDVITDLLLVKDTLGRRLYGTLAELAAGLRVKDIVEVEVMAGVVHPDTEKPLFGIIVNLNDYTVGADKGGDVNAFDDFDINFNQYHYLIETRISGALTKPKSALVLELPAPVIEG
jgi:HK97 family phage major capsid protein